MAVAPRPAKRAGRPRLGFRWLAVVRGKLVQLRAAVRWNEWYASKLPFVWTACLSAAATSPFGHSELEGRVAAVIVFTCLCAAFGHVANDYADRDCDALVGKLSPSAGLSERGAWLVMAALCAFALGALAVAAVGTGPAAAAAGLATLGAAAAYSLRPVRLKARGAAGLWSAAAAQRTFPVLVAFAALGPLNAEAWAFAAVAQLAGLRWMLVHQIADAMNDRRAGVGSYVAAVGEPRARVLLRWVVLPLELLAVVAALWIAGASRPTVWAIAATGLLAGGLRALLCWRRAQPAYSLEGYGRQPLAGFYQAIWPIGAGVLLVASRPELWPLLAAVLLWQSRYILAQLGMVLRLVRQQRCAAGARSGWSPTDTGPGAAAPR